MKIVTGRRHPLHYYRIRYLERIHRAGVRLHPPEIELLFAYIKELEKTTGPFTGDKEKP